MAASVHRHERGGGGKGPKQTCMYDACWHTHTEGSASYVQNQGRRRRWRCVSLTLPPPAPLLPSRPLLLPSGSAPPPTPLPSPHPPELPLALSPPQGLLRRLPPLPLLWWATLPPPWHPPPSPQLRPPLPWLPRVPAHPVAGWEGQGPRGTLASGPQCSLPGRTAGTCGAGRKGTDAWHVINAGRAGGNALF